MWLKDASAWASAIQEEHSVWKSHKKVSFNIASEAKNGPFWRVFEKLKLAVKQCYQTGQF